MIASWLYAWLILALWQGLLFVYQRRNNDGGIVDVGWALSMAFMAIWLCWHGEGDLTRRAVLAILATLWGVRLALHLFVNRIRAAGEDGRYAMLRESWGSKAQRNFFIFFQVQAAWSLLFAVPFAVIAAGNTTWGSAADWLSIAIWLLAVGGESLADWQLESWKAEAANAGKTCRSGLWRYSRHPNYFFEWLHWWAYVALAWHEPQWWIALSGPVLMLFFLLKVTGIPYTEKRALASRGDDYRRYQKSTSAFFPWFPGKEEEN